MENALLGSFPFDSPVLDCAFANANDSTMMVAGLLDGNVTLCNLEARTPVVLGSHSDGVRVLVSAPNFGLIISGSWDGTVKCWDPRQERPVSTVPQEGKVFAADGVGNRLVVATANRHIAIWDLRKMQEPSQRRLSSLKTQSRSLHCMPDRKGFALGSVEGRVAVEYFDISADVQAKKYAFKCHRQVVDGVDTVYPVNAIVWHPSYGTFATGGCDGHVAIWDGNLKKRCALLPKYATSIASLSFSPDGNTLAIAVSYTWEQGDIAHPADAIYVKDVSELAKPRKPKV